MKIRYLIDTIFAPSLTALDWVDLYGGMVQTSLFKKDGVVKRFPVSCDTNTKDCNNLGKLQNLVPNDSRKSIMYWEELQPMSDRGMTRQGNYFYRKYEGKARLVVWMNLLKLGQTTCQTSIDALLQLENILAIKGRISGGAFDDSQFMALPSSTVKKDIKTIFGKYDYDELKNYYLTPYDYFAIDVSFSIEQCLKRDNALIVNPSLDCANGGGLIDSCAVLLAQLTASQKNECILPAYDFTDTATSSNLTPTQEDDLRDLLCTLPEPTAKSFILNGVNEHIVFPLNAAYEFEYNTPFTLSCWVKFDSLKTANLFNKYSTAGADRGFFLIGLANGALRMDLQNDGGIMGLSVTTPSSTVNAGQWYHIAMTYGGSPVPSSIKIYVNGVSIGLTTLNNTLGNNTIKNNSIPLRIGTNDTLLNGIDGLISDCLIWNTELTQSDVTSEYNRKLTGTPAQSGDLVAWIKGATNSQFGVDTFTQADSSNTIIGVKTVNIESNETSLDVPI